MIRFLTGVAVLLAFVSSMQAAETPTTPPQGASTAPNPYQTDTPPVGTTPGEIDRLVFGQLEKLGIEPALPCSDPVFLRRIYLAVIGTLPTREETKTFLESTDPQKRSKLIDTVLARNEYADFWAMKWGDLLRVKAEFPINLWPNAVQAYHRWIVTSLRGDKPYDVFARELLTSSGSNFRVPQVNFYRAMQGQDAQAIAGTVALTMMGQRLDTWSEERQAGIAAFFSEVGFKQTAEWKEEVVFHDPWKGGASGEGGVVRKAVFPDGSPARWQAGEDPRLLLADWLLHPDHPAFSQSIANRAWFWLMGRGIVHEPDDFRADNPPVNPELLNYLAAEMVQGGYDMKHLFRLILNSRTYQLSSVPRSDHPEAAANFACYPVRRLEAEVLIDALCGLTDTNEKYTSPIPEPFTYIPENQRSIVLADGSITSPFLEMFGRPSRDTGLESERSNRPTPDQRLHLLNSSHVRQKLEGSNRLRNLTQSRKGKGPLVPLDGLYLTVLSRYPTDAERQAVRAYAQAPGMNPRTAAIDVTWALINSKEFLYRH